MGENQMATKQTEANKRWQEQNKEYSNYLKSRSTARGFIKNKATVEDLMDLKKMIEERIKED
ncbi:hypothetical protein H8718_06175 [Lachnospiraceae bacterium NSJ-12]|uniref:Uncharacterized protein n=2 Tax=Zhenhengia yiwuensis TaxID=2763666 RepID=A0A926EJ53_9FIRM|nr:hypothetical protein [Zhenhengia yiwuensis]